MSGDLGDKDKRTTVEVENMRTGEFEKKEAIWVRAQGMKLSKYEDVRDSKSGSKQYISDKPGKAAVQNINKRIGNFAAWQ